MKLIPYLNFNGNCKAAIEFYQKVFNVTAEYCLYEDIGKFDNSMTVEKGKEKWVMHGNLKLGDGVEIQLADCDENGAKTSSNICLQLSYDTLDQVKSVFNALEKGGRVVCPPTPTFYSPLYSVVVDKFGICWSIMQMQPVQ